MDTNIYSLIIPVSYYISPKSSEPEYSHGSGLLEDRYRHKDGEVFFDPCYSLPLSQNYEINIVNKHNGALSHFTYEGDIDSCKEIIDWFGIEEPTLTILPDREPVEVVDPAQEFFKRVKDLSASDANKVISTNKNCTIMASDLDSPEWFITWAWHGYWSIGPGAHDF